MNYRLTHVDQDRNAFALVHVAHEDTADRDLVALPIERDRALLVLVVTASLEDEFVPAVNVTWCVFSS